MGTVGDARIKVPDRITRGEIITVNSIISHPMDTGFFRTAEGKPIPAWFIKLVVLGLLWAYLHHFIAGVRHLWMDATHSVSKAQGHNSAVITLVLSIALTLVLGAKLFGLY